MKVSGKTILDILLHLKARLHGNSLAQQYAGDEPPLRAELFSSDQMEQHGKTLAGSHRVKVSRAPDKLLSRLGENEGVLRGACHLLSEAVRQDSRGNIRL